MDIANSLSRKRERNQLSAVSAYGQDADDISDMGCRAAHYEMQLSVDTPRGTFFIHCSRPTIASGSTTPFGSLGLHADCR